MTHCCVIDLADVGDRVPGSSGKRGKQVTTIELHVRFAVLLCKRFGDFGKKERESLESH